MANSHKVVRYGRDQFTQREFNTASVVGVGMLVERSGAGDVQPHSTAGGTMDQVFVAKDDRSMGMELGDEYPASTRAKVLDCNSGVGLHLQLAAGTDLTTAANANVAVGDRLVSNGDGTLRKLDTSITGETEAGVVAVADEAYDNSAAATGETYDLAIEVTR